MVTGAISLFLISSMALFDKGYEIWYNPNHLLRPETASSIIEHLLNDAFLKTKATPTFYL